MEMFGTENQSLQKNRKEIFGKKKQIEHNGSGTFQHRKTSLMCSLLGHEPFCKKKETLRNTLAVFLRTPMIPSENITICWLRSFLPEKKNNAFLILSVILVKNPRGFFSRGLFIQ